jgi:flagellar motor switch protein FliN
MADQNDDASTDPSDDWAAALAEQASSTDSASNDDADALFAQADTTKPAAGLFQPFAGNTASGQKNDIEMILDIPVQLTVELGRTKIPIKHILQLAQGSVIELDGLAGEPMDVLVNGYLIAQGEVVVVNDKFGIRLTDIINPSERLRKLNR